MCKIIFLISWIFSEAVLGMNPQLFLTHCGKVKPEVFDLFKSLGYRGSLHIDELNNYAQRNFLRPPHLERWELREKKILSGSRQEIISTLKGLGFFKEVLPRLDLPYENVLILGASAERMRMRVSFLNKLVDKGLIFKKIYFLTGDRPLDLSVEKQEVLFPGDFDSEGKREEKYHTESDAAKFIWRRLGKPDIQVPRFVHLPMKGKQRPTTKDTINGWLALNPNKGRTLVISNNPYVSYQHAVVAHALLEAAFLNLNRIDSVTTVGAGADSTVEKLAVLLDNLARTLYNERLVWKSFFRKSDQ